MNLLTNLLPHQQAAVDKIGGLKIGALFMEMGTGKSRTAIEIVARRNEKIERVVWFCPVSLKQTVAMEIKKHVENPEIYVFNSKTTDNNIPKNAFWIVVGIESMSSSDRVILSAASIINDKTMVILDESSYIKGHKSERTHWITDASKPARYRMILTGTPMSQGVVDLFAQMRFLDEKILGYKSFFSFQSNHLEYSDKYPGKIVHAHNLDWLASKIAPYTYQVKKSECIVLPKKEYLENCFWLNKIQRQNYDAAKVEFAELIFKEDLQNYEHGKMVSITHSILIFRLFSKLQQITSCIDQIGKENNRLHALDLVLDTIPDGEKVIIWTKYLKNVELISNKIADRGEVAQFHGGLSEKQRNAEIDKFRKSARFFVSTTQSGGHGLTLNEACYVVFYDNDFKLATRLQAEDRNHRIGQNRLVTYIDITAFSSIDERIQESLRKKGDVVKDFTKKIKSMRDKKSVLEALKSL